MVKDLRSKGQQMLYKLESMDVVDSVDVLIQCLQISLPQSVIRSNDSD